MCGRYASTRSTLDLSTLFEALDESEGVLAPDYNLAPTDPAAIIRHTTRHPDRVLSAARWGFVPAWSRDLSGGARMINARAETVASSRAFARAFAQYRCLVPAEGWYEWLRQDGRRPAAAARARSLPHARTPSRQPYFMTRTDGTPLAFGGIWSVWGAGEQRLLTFSVITLPAVGDLAEIHDRMPLIIDPDRRQAWLTSTDPAALLAAPAPDYLAGLELRPVSAAVGDVRNDGPELIRRVATEPDMQSSVELHNPTLF